jgi:hypothetical protein
MEPEEGKEPNLLSAASGEGVRVSDVSVSRERRPWVSPDILDDLCQMVFGSLRRSDQRRWAETYVRGLLTAIGRKSMRRIAADAGPGREHGLHQFISKSPWEWRPVRQALTSYLQRETDLVAWVLEPFFILKAGEHSVGVERQFVPHLGRMSNCQQAYGVWMVTEESSYPVEWGLALPDSWTADSDLRRRGGIPEHLGPRSPFQCGIEAFLSLADPRRPVLMEVADAELATACTILSSRRLPFLLKVSGTIPVAATDPGSAFAGHWVSGRRLVDGLGGQSRPVEWIDPARGRRRVTSVAATAVHVHTGGEAGASGLVSQPLLLIGAWSDPSSSRPCDFWLTNCLQHPPTALFRTAQLARAVRRDFQNVSVPVGVNDFEGRTFRGWHHHTTLVSVAHAASLLSQVQESRYARIPPIPASRPGHRAAAGSHPARGTRPMGTTRFERDPHLSVPAI